MNEGRLNPIICIGCGCDDDHACEGGCRWLIIDEPLGAGVCSNCSDHLVRWEMLDRTFSVAAQQRQADIELEEEGWIEIDEEAPEGPCLILPGHPDFRW